MPQDAILAIDLGTSGCRAELFGADGGSLGRAYREYRLLCPEPGAAEQDAEGWLTTVAECCSRAGAAAGNAVSVRAVGLSVQGHSWVPVDEHFRPLRPALTWLDTRAAEQARTLLEHHSAEFWGRTAGKLPGQWHLLPQLLHLRRREPEIMARAAYYLTAHDFLIAHLTGRPVTDYTHAATTLLFDLQTWQWSQNLLDEYGVNAGTLPSLQPAGTIAGRLINRQLIGGLPAADETPVAVGAQDQKCAALAAGLVEGTATASLGTATAITALVRQPRFDPARGAIPCFPYLGRDEWVLEAPLATSGGAVRWLRDLLTETGSTDYQAMVAAAREVPPGTEGVVFFPYLAGAGAPSWRGEARGAFCGLSLRTGPRHLMRAVLEAVAYEIRENLGLMRDLGCPLQCLRLFGGGVRGGLWPEIVAAVAGMPTEACGEGEAAVHGAAMLAATAGGLNRELFTIASQPVTVEPELSERYQELCQSYRRAKQFYWPLDAALARSSL